MSLEGEDRRRSIECKLKSSYHDGSGRDYFLEMTAQ